jgi:hypothetical protein
LARRSDLYLKTDNVLKRETPVPPVGFKPTISASEGPQTQAFDLAANRIGYNEFHYAISLSFSNFILLFLHILLTPFFATPQSVFHLLYEQL